MSPPRSGRRTHERPNIWRPPIGACRESPLGNRCADDLRRRKVVIFPNLAVVTAFVLTSAAGSSSQRYIPGQFFYLAVRFRVRFAVVSRIGRFEWLPPNRESTFARWSTAWRPASFSTANSNPRSMEPPAAASGTEGNVTMPRTRRANSFAGSGGRTKTSLVLIAWLVPSACRGSRTDLGCSARRARRRRSSSDDSSDVVIDPKRALRDAHLKASRSWRLNDAAAMEVDR
jgi:hypothetical protein